MFHTFLVEYDPISTMLTTDGYESISEQFGYVDREDRADVFIMFKDLLEDRGIPYDPRQFGGNDYYGKGPEIWMRGMYK